MKYRYLILFFITTHINASYLDYIYKDRSITSNSFGQSGLIQIPSAEIKKAGTISVTYNKNNIYKIATVSVTPFDWMEASYFYYRPSDLIWGGTPGHYLDKGFNVKFNKKLLSYPSTTVAVGLEDFAGTGLFAREYIALTTHMNFLKITGGLGWGKYNGVKSYKNPFSYLSEKFSFREGFDLQEIYDTGRPSTNKWFKGDIGIFGGFEIFIPKSRGLKFKIEYDPFDYMDFSCCGEGYSEKSMELRRKDSDINYGISYPLTKRFVVDLSYLHGNKINFSFVYNINLVNKKQKNKRPPEVYKKTNFVNGTKKGFHRDLLSNMNNNGYFLQYANIKDKNLDLVIQNTQYKNPILLSQSVAKLANKVTKNNGYDVNLISVSQMNAGMGLNNITYQTTDLDNEEKYQSLTEIRTKIEPISNNEINKYQFKPKPIFPFSSSSFDFELAAHAGSPEQFLYKGIVFNFNNQTQFSRSIHLDTKISYLTADDFNEKSSRPDSALPHVRSEIVSYLQESEFYIDHSHLNFYKSIGNDIYSRFTLGILESMYSGIGGEILFTPFESNLSMSANVFKVYRRAYDRKFKTLDYSTITGHIDGTYLHEPSNILFKLSYGKYLAGDKGYTLDLSRLFDSGFRTGFYFTRTNVSFEQFGEGSFDKGFYFIIPFDIFSDNHSRGNINFTYNPLTRDGGQKLIINNSIEGLIFNSQRYKNNRGWHDYRN